MWTAFSSGCLGGRPLLGRDSLIPRQRDGANLTNGVVDSSNRKNVRTDVRRDVRMGVHADIRTDVLTDVRTDVCRDLRTLRKLRPFRRFSLRVPLGVIVLSIVLYNMYGNGTFQGRFVLLRLQSIKSLSLLCFGCSEQCAFSFLVFKWAVSRS